MNILICDDDRHDIQIVKSQVQKFGEEQHVEIHTIEISRLRTIDEILNMVGKEQVDVAFLDIDMPYISGDEIAEKLAMRYPGVSIIFFTNQDELVYDMIRYKPFRFIRKRDASEIADTMRALLNVRMDSGYVEVETGRTEVANISVKELRYVEVIHRQVFYHTTTETFVTHCSMEKCAGKLEEYGFIRTHVAYLINVKWIKRIERKEVILLDDTSIPLGGSYRLEVLKKYKIMLERTKYGKSS